MHSSFHSFMFQNSTIHIHSSIQPCSPVAGGGLSGRAPAALAKCHVNILCSYSTGYDKIHLKSHHFANDSVTFSCSSHCSGNSAWRPARDNKWVGGPSVLDKGVCLTVQFFTVACAFWILSRGSGTMQYLWKMMGSHLTFFLVFVGLSGSLT